MNVAVVQETYFTCTTDFRVLEDDFVAFSAYGNRSSVEVSQLIGRSLNTDVNLVLADDRSQLVVADVAVKNFEFWVVAVYAPNIDLERVFIFQRLAPFLDDQKRIVLVGDWNVILDHKIDRIGRGARRSGRGENSLIDLMTCHDLVDRFRLDHQGQEMWTWLDSSPPVRARSYLARVLEVPTLILLHVPHSTIWRRLIIGLLGSICG